MYTLSLSLTSYVENSLVVTLRYEKDFKRKPQKSRNRRNSGDQAFDCMEDVQKGQKSDARAQRSPHPQHLQP